MTDDSRHTDNLQVATLAGGCFWCLEAVFDEIEGVTHVKSGYAGGHTTDPTYQQVCSGSTGHAEVTQITFDPGQVTYRDLLNVFFSIHDPTTVDRQGNDVGSQYRSAIFTHDAQQAETARQVAAEVSAAGIYPGKLVTSIEPLTDFYPAEDYHDDYYARNPGQGYCQVVIAPKLAKFRKQHVDRLRRAAPLPTAASTSAR
ncbi:MAG TPA: peptide-methionine (S)-S-oxide reductase MsrA [Trueperaceae bacterium]|nr:peptide-methionine (S)-S-oxide reductase MsrA [Trueperaceae bacterium]